MRSHQTVLILHNIRSVQNVGAIFRTADAAGVGHIYLSGYTPTPIDRFGIHRKDFTKAALGAESSVPWSQYKTATNVIVKLKKDGFTIYAVEQDKNSIDYRDAPHPSKLAIIMGNEVLGISPALRKRADKIIELPMVGKKESLNVSVAAGIVMYRFFPKK
jgi:23S rRNA (guanosine2251-2'-O)-methyltransferase